MPTRDTDPVRTLADLIRGMRFAMLTTEDGEGNLHSRPMVVQEQEFAGELWFLTARSSHKVSDIIARPRVNVAFADADHQRYISIAGLADLVDERDRLRELWSPAYQAWFPGGIDDPELIAMRVRVIEADYWVSPTSAVVKLVGFLHAVATGQPTDLGRHEHLDLRD